MTSADGRTQRSRAYHERQRRDQLPDPMAEGKRIRDEETPHYVYRCYDANGLLLYIGCTADVETRMELHRSQHATWMIYRNPKCNLVSVELISRMARHEVSGPIKGRLAARAAEKAAIQAEHPLLNIHHNQGARSAS